MLLEIPREAPRLGPGENSPSARGGKLKVRADVVRETVLCIDIANCSTIAAGTAPPIAGIAKMEEKGQFHIIDISVWLIPHPEREHWDTYSPPDAFSP